MAEYRHRKLIPLSPPPLGLHAPPDSPGSLFSDTNDAGVKSFRLHPHLIIST